MTLPPRERPGIPLRAVVPNAVTALALCSGLSGIRFAITGEWDKALMFIVIAALLDGLDGRIARLLRGQSRFGAELDSLSDVVAFGVAPALIIYLWVLQIGHSHRRVVLLIYLTAILSAVVTFLYRHMIEAPFEWLVVRRR